MRSQDLVKQLLEHRDSLFGFILALTHDRETAEEIFQEVGLAVVEEASRATGVERFLPWAHEIARRRIAEHYRKQSRRHARETPEALENAVSLAFQEHAADPGLAQRRNRYLEECLGDLTPPQRQLVEGRYRDRTPLHAMAGRLGSTEGSVKVLLWKIRRQLARCIQGKLAHFEGER